MRWRGLLWTGAIVAAWAPVSSAWVERLYSRGLFPVLQRALTTVSNGFSFALFDVLLGAVLIWTAVTVMWALSVARPRGWLPALGAACGRLLTTAAAAYLVFLLAWGLNYRREPLERRVWFDATRVSPDAARALGDETVNQVNRLYESASRGPWPNPGTLDPALAQAFARAQRTLGAKGRFVPARPKRTLLDGYFRRAGVAGMTDPYFLETLVATDLLAVERPMVVAHEWSHLAGIASEGEANFAGWLACLHGSAFHQYSGWLFLYGEVSGALGPADARRVAANLGEGPRLDLQAIRARLLHNVSPVVSGAGWRVYDQYLKANRVDGGTASYADVVRLVLGTEFDGDWMPRIR